VAKHAVDAHFVRSMAIHAVSHGDGYLPEESLTIRYLAVTRFTLRAGIEMILVAEENEAGDLIHANPWDRFLTRRKSR
jgi:hypothetical protein